MKEIIEKFKEIIINIIDEEDIVEIDEDFIEKDLLNDFGFDSLNIISLIVEIEEKFNIEFDDDFLEMENMRRPKFIIEYIERKLKNGWNKKNY